jgi:hypothetical protein
MPLAPNSPSYSSGGGSSIPRQYLIGGGAALLVIGYYAYSKYKANQTAAATASNTGSGPDTLSVNANVAPTSSLDQWPQNQLNMPGMNTTDINQQLLMAGQAQQAVVNQ